MSAARPSAEPPPRDGAHAAAARADPADAARAHGAGDTGAHDIGGTGAHAAAIRRADELLQLLYWLRGEGFAESATLEDVLRFLGDAGAAQVVADLQALAAAGLVADDGAGRYRLTAQGAAEGGRRFAEEFAELQRPGHGECDDPECDCHELGPEACVHHSA